MRPWSVCLDWQKMAGSIAAIAFVAAIGPRAGAQPLSLVPIGVYESGVFDGSAAEIAAYHPATRRLFVVDAQAGVVALDLTDPKRPHPAFTMPAAGVNSVAVAGDRLALAIANADRTHPGIVRFHRLDGTFVRAVAVGAGPDMIAFTPDGRYLLCADEGEPSDDYATDPPGGITVIHVADGAARRIVFDERQAVGPNPPRVAGPPGVDLRRDAEPEYIAVAADGATAYVALQENNAIACIDVPSAGVRWIAGLGLKPFNQVGSGLDPSDRDAGAAIQPHPVWGLYQPDAIALIEHGGDHFLVTANEGDPRDYPGFTDQARAADVTVDPERYPAGSGLLEPDALGRLKVSTADGDDDGDGDVDRLVAFGGRSISVWRVDPTVSGPDGAAPLALVYDSKDAFERLTATLEPRLFNANNDDQPSTDDRSDDRGPEPEGLAIGTIGDRRYLFVGLERPGGVVAFDIADPTSPILVDYENPRDPLVPPTLEDGRPNPAAGDLGPEGLLFIPADKSPNGRPLLIVCNEVSGTVRVYSLN